MTRELPRDDAGDEWIQFRGRQTSVTVDDFGIRFVCSERELPSGATIVQHDPLPVVDRDADDPPANAVVRAVAEAITNGDLSNPVICWGVVCEHPVGDGEICGEVFASPEALNSHLGSHATEDTTEDEEQ
jgi:hypothetical protein